MEIDSLTLIILIFGSLLGEMAVAFLITSRVVIWQFKRQLPKILLDLVADKELTAFIRQQVIPAFLGTRGGRPQSLMAWAKEMGMQAFGGILQGQIQKLGKPNIAEVAKDVVE